MNIRKNIRRILFFTLWTILSAGVLVLLVAAVNIKNQKACKRMEIRIKGVEYFYFLDKKDVSRIIADAGVYTPVGKPLAEFNLLHLESLLEKNVWVKDAELFFDNNQVLYINIMEREPIARLFSLSGGSFYIDSSGFRMPLSEKMSVRVPVFTGFPTDKARLNSKDSLLLADIRKISRYVFMNPFWMAQIAHIDITPARNFRMFPTVGNHVIEFGGGEAYESKFRRLFAFYKQVLGRTGFDKYSRIDVQYGRQVVATRKGPVPKIDSLKALKNIEAMIRETMKITEDSVFIPEVTYPAGKRAVDSSLWVSRNSASQPKEKGGPAPGVQVKAVVKEKEKPARAAPVKKTAAAPRVTAQVKTTPKKGAASAPPVQQKPKAVMQKMKNT